MVVYKYKKTLLIDFDGVLNEYCGEFNENVIPPLKCGAKEFLEKLSDDYLIKIFTSRNLRQVNEWLKKHNLIQYIEGVTNTKEPAFLQIDDRCLKFEGDYDNIYKQISDFKVWYKD